MTVTYDGHLVTDGRTVEPCCAHMHRVLMTGMIKCVSSKARGITMALHVEDRTNIPIIGCPFCGAKTEVTK